MLPSALSRAIGFARCMLGVLGSPVLPSVWRPVVLLWQSGTWARPLTQSPELGFAFVFSLPGTVLFLRGCGHCRWAAVVQRFVHFSSLNNSLQMLVLIVQHNDHGCEIAIALSDGRMLGSQVFALGFRSTPLHCLRLGFLVPFRVDSGRQGIQPAEKCDNLPYMIVRHCFIVVPLPVPG
jgi:hypothetical protein